MVEPREAIDIDAEQPDRTQVTFGERDGARDLSESEPAVRQPRHGLGQGEVVEPAVRVSERDLGGAVGEQDGRAFGDLDVTRVGPLPLADLDDAGRQSRKTALSRFAGRPPRDRTRGRVPAHEVARLIEHGEAIAHGIGELRFERQRLYRNDGHPISLPSGRRSDDRCAWGVVGHVGPLPHQGPLPLQYPRGESNACLRLRRPPLYPLSYGGG